MAGACHQLFVKPNKIIWKVIHVDVLKTHSSSWTCEMMEDFFLNFRNSSLRSTGVDQVPSIPSRRSERLESRNSSLRHGLWRHPVRNRFPDQEGQRVLPGISGPVRRSQEPHPSLPQRLFEREGEPEHPRRAPVAQVQGDRAAEGETGLAKDHLLSGQRRQQRSHRNNNSNNGRGSGRQRQQQQLQRLRRGHDDFGKRLLDGDRRNQRLGVAGRLWVRVPAPGLILERPAVNVRVQTDADSVARLGLQQADAFQGQRIWPRGRELLLGRVFGHVCLASAAVLLPEPVQVSRRSHDVRWDRQPAGQEVPCKPPTLPEFTAAAATTAAVGPATVSPVEVEASHHSEDVKEKRRQET